MTTRETTSDSAALGRDSSGVDGEGGGGVTTLPRIPNRVNKIYRAPPTPPLERLVDREKAFVLDSIAVSNISTDYSRANPKLGSVIPPYNSLDDRAISRYFNSYGVCELLKKNGQVN